MTQSNATADPVEAVERIVASAISRALRAELCPVLGRSIEYRTKERKAAASKATIDIIAAIEAMRAAQPVEAVARAAYLRGYDDGAHDALEQGGTPHFDSRNEGCADYLPEAMRAAHVTAQEGE